MISFLRTKLSLSSPLHKAPILTVMDSYGSQRLVALAQQLRFYKPPSLSPDEIEDQNIEESSGKVVPPSGGFKNLQPQSLKTLKGLDPIELLF
ncbi:hypothetical protein OIU78_000398 [Salix suchowensis]|nr:hypothetical protein OIU78_000398 [Salix suchowensis]